MSTSCCSPCIWWPYVALKQKRKADQIHLTMRTNLNPGSQYPWSSSPAPYNVNIFVSPLLLVWRLYLSKASVCLSLFLRNSWELIVLIVLWRDHFFFSVSIITEDFDFPISVFFLMNDSDSFTNKEFNGGFWWPVPLCCVPINLQTSCATPSPQGSLHTSTHLCLAVNLSSESYPHALLLYLDRTWLYLETPLVSTTCHSSPHLLLPKT